MFAGWLAQNPRHCERSEANQFSTLLDCFVAMLPAMTIRWTRGEHLAGAIGAWRGELRATLALAWPLILANLTQQAIQATDVLLMGRLGASQLAAATLALNLTFTFNLFLLGLLTASSPMMATALGQRSNAVRDVRRTFRAGCG